ncbi:metallophosphoesterase [Tsukamurella strandjordii]|uniref:metallophosphoesterase family protein n=1 Tax=Tsukamurella TaxID=2060 RepID=UPI001C7DCF37|nr:metallophosphoesterase family protein [Tsukamurella sp. TY48]GIZ99463.1 DNA methylase [Tsukamurella sp. TY48]
MRIAAISDVHGNAFALRAVLESIQHDHVDVIVNLGDHFSGAVLPAETARLMKTVPMVCIRGNHERQLEELEPSAMGASDRCALEQLGDDHCEWLTSMPRSADIGAGVFAFHGTPEDDLEYLLETVTEQGAREATVEEVVERLKGYLDRDLLLCGHTHIQRSLRIPQGPLVVNPGSVGWPAYDDDRPYPHVMEAGTPHARYAVVDDVSGRWEAEFRALEYPWGKAAEIAASRGRADVEYALLTGRVRTAAQGR